MDARLKRIQRNGRTLSVPINLGGGKSTKNPSAVLGQLIQDAIDPTKMPGPCRSLKDMTKEEKAALAKQYGAEVTDSDSDTLITVETVIDFVTEKAVKVHQRHNYRKEAWLPKSAIHYDGELIVGELKTLRIPIWLAKEWKLRSSARNPGKAEEK